MNDLTAVRLEEWHLLQKHWREGEKGHLRPGNLNIIKVTTKSLDKFTPNLTEDGKQV